jgi:lysophospholipase L1-like esterase
VLGALAAVPEDLAGVQAQGDSPLTACLYPQNPQRQADIINRGYGGYNSRWGAWLIDEVLATYAPEGRIRLATIGFGANDAAAPDKQ